MNHVVSNHAPETGAVVPTQLKRNSVEQRDGYADGLRAIAIVRVVLFHVTLAGWLTVLFPSMGVMFALGGHFFAQTYERRGVSSVMRRLRRILPSFWLLGIVVVPLSVYANWRYGGSDPSPVHLLSWFFPFVDPTGSQHIDATWRPLWYLRAYVWFLLLTPIVYNMVKRFPWPSIAAPVIAIVAINPDVLYRLYDTNAFGAVGVDLLTYGACWMIGIASFTGALQKTSARFVALVASALGALALYDIVKQAVITGGHIELGPAPSDNALWCAAFALVLLRFRPGARLLEASERLTAATRKISGRSLTIYLWHGTAIAGGHWLLGKSALQTWNTHYTTSLLLLVIGLTAVATVTAGWAEDRARPKKLAFVRR